MDVSEDVAVNKAGGRSFQTTPVYLGSDGVGCHYILDDSGISKMSREWRVEEKYEFGDDAMGHTGDNLYSRLGGGDIVLWDVDCKTKLEKVFLSDKDWGESYSIIPARERVVVSRMARQLFSDLLVWDLAGLVGRYV